MSTFPGDYRKTVPVLATAPDRGLFLLFGHAETFPRAVNANCQSSLLLLPILMHTDEIVLSLT